MDALDASLAIFLALLSFCGKSEAYIMNKKDDETLLILAITFVIVLIIMIFVLLILMCFYCSRQRREKWEANFASKDLYSTSFRSTKESPFYGGANAQGNGKKNVYLPHYETAGPMYENPGPVSKQYRVEQGEEPQEYETLDMGEMQKPTSFSNEGYETMGASTTTISSKTTEQVSSQPDTVSTEKPATNGSLTESTEKTVNGVQYNNVKTTITEQVSIHSDTVSTEKPATYASLTVSTEEPVNGGQYSYVNTTITNDYESLEPSAPLEEEEDSEDDTAF